MVGVSASVNLPLHHKVQKFSSGTGSPGWSRKKGRKTVVISYIVCHHIAQGNILERVLTFTRCFMRFHCQEQEPNLESVVSVTVVWPPAMVFADSNVFTKQLKSVLFDTHIDDFLYAAPGHCVKWSPANVIMAAPRSRCGHYIFVLWFLSFFYSSPNLSGRRLDVCHTSTHGVALVRV